MNKTFISKFIFKQLPKDVFYLLKKIEKNGYQCYVVGGALRDILLKKKINDIDLASNARPIDIKNIFPKTIDTGIKHGTISIYFRRKIYEITTFRHEDNYFDHRHPSLVKFVSSLKEDLIRRDFTINAFAFNPREGLIDLFNGLEDLKHRLIKAIGNPTERFNEDALRMLRAFRFASQIDGKIETNTFLAIEKLAYLINSISVERIREEFDKILLNNHPEVLLNCPLNPFILLNDKLKKTKRNLFAFNLLKKSPHNLVSRLVLFYDLMDFSLNDIAMILKHYKYSNYTISRVNLFSKYLSFAIPIDKIKIKFLIKDLGGYDVLNQLILLKKYSIHHYQEKIDLSYLKSLHLDECIYNISDLAIGGNDLVNLGFMGKNISLILNAILDLVIAEKIPNQKENLLAYIKDNF